MKLRPSVAFLAPAAFVLGGYLALSSNVARAFAYEAITVTSILAVLAGVWLHRPRDRRGTSSPPV